MKIEIKILTPVHIGNGNEISPLEYFIDKNKFIRINMNSLFNDPEFKPFQEKFIKLASNLRYSGDLLPKQLLLKHPLYTIDISTNIKNYINVKEFIKSAGRVFISGSSLKGSILSGVIYEVAKQKQINKKEQLINLMEISISEISKESSRGKFSRWLDVSDSNLISPNECLEISSAAATGGARKGIPLLYETLKTGTTFITEIKTSLDSFYKFGKLTPEEILNAANKFYRKIYTKFKYSFQIPSDGYLIRLGQGSSVLATSFILIAEENGIQNYTIPRKKLSPLKPNELPRTQKLIDGKIPMGWVIVKPIQK